MARTYYRIRLAPDLTATTTDRDLAERRARDGYHVSAVTEGGV